MERDEILVRVLSIRSRICDGQRIIINFLFEAELGFDSPAVVRAQRRLGVLEEVLDAYIRMLHDANTFVGKASRRR